MCIYIFEATPFCFSQESKQRKGGREYFFDLKKKEEGFWPRLLKETKKVFYYVFWSALKLFFLHQQPCRKFYICGDI